VTDDHRSLSTDELNQHADALLAKMHRLTAEWLEAKHDYRDVVGEIKRRG